MKRKPARLLRCILFSAAMAYAEAAVVIYLRDLLHPGGLTFPLPPIPPFYLAAEVGREAATLLMLAALSTLAFRAARERAACFFVCFGVWDIGYYLWLKLLIDWPRGLLDWDVLFLIPLPWVGPVLSPLLVSLLLIAAGLRLLFSRPRLSARPRSRLSLLTASLGGLLVLATYFWNSGAVLHGDRPQSYPWWLWAAGILLALFSFRRRI